MLPSGDTRRCPICKGSTDNQRYKISLRGEDIQFTSTDTEVIGDFMFFGDQGSALIGHDAALLVSQARGRHGYTPPSITDVVGKTYDITAQVNQDSYDKNPGHIILKVSKVEMSVATLPREQTSPQQSLPAPTSNDPQATPVKDVISSPSVHTEKAAASTTDGKKRKDSSPAFESSAKRATTVAKETAKALFKT